MTLVILVEINQVRKIAPGLIKKKPAQKLITSPNKG